MSIKKVERKIFKSIRDIMTFTGDAVGLAALKLGHEAFAYKTITSMRKKGQVMEGNFDDFLEDNIEKVKVRVTEADLKDFKNKVKEGFSSVREGKNIFVTEETKIYGDAQHFYEEDDMVFTEEGIILEEIIISDDDLDID